MNQKQKIFLAAAAGVVAWGWALYTIFGGGSPGSASRPAGNKSGNPNQAVQAGPPRAAGRFRGSGLPVEYRATRGIFNYQPQGVPDPFGGYTKLNLKPKKNDFDKSKLVEPELSSLVLTGIMWDETQPLATVKTPDGKTHNIQVGDVIEEETIIKINEESVIVSRPFLKKKILFELKLGSQSKL